MGSVTDLTAAILCGGQGTRLRPALPHRQKAMAEVAGKPFLDRLVDWASRQGLRRFVFCTGYRSEDVEHYFSGRRDIEPRFSRETEPLGTAGALHLASPLLGEGTTLVLNGDSICAIELAPFLEQHRRSRAPATLVIAPALGRDDGGGVEADPSGRVLAFSERAVAKEGWINAGVYLVDRPLLESIADRTHCSLERDIFPRWVGRGLAAYRTGEPVYDIGTPERWAEFRERCQA